MISISSPSFCLEDFSIMLERISKHFPAWEIMSEGKHSVLEIEQRFRDLAPSYDLHFSVHGPLGDVNIGSLNPRMRRAALKEVIDAMKACDRMGIGVYTIHPGFVNPLGVMDRKTAYAVIHESIKAIDSAAREMSMVVAMENMPSLPFATCKEPAELLDFIHGTILRVCFDVGHAHTNGNMGDWLKLVDRFSNVHIHDNLGQMDQHLIIGEGNIDFSSVLNALRPYKGNLVIEARNLEEGIVSQERLQKYISTLD